MTDRDRLIKLIYDAKCVETWDYYNDEPMQPCPIEKLADYLLANDVIASPLKLGDKIYRIFGNKIVKIEVSDIEIEFRNFFKKKYRYNYNAFTNEDFGKTVFLTKEQAEEKLKRIEDNGN